MKTVAQQFEKKNRTTAAYPLSRFRLRFGRTFLYTILFATGLPMTAVMVPVYGLFVRTNLIDSIWATTVFLATTSLPTAIWLAKNFIDGIPIELEEAALTDGANMFQMLRRIVLPLISSGAATVGIFTFVGIWGNFFVPFTLLPDPAKQPVAVGIFSFFGDHGMVAYGQLAAYSLVYTTPVLGLFLTVAKFLDGGFTMARAVKL